MTVIDTLINQIKKLPNTTVQDRRTPNGLGSISICEMLINGGLKFQSIWIGRPSTEESLHHYIASRTPALALTKAQAEAVASAVCALNNVGSRPLETSFVSPTQRINVFASKRVRLTVMSRTLVPATKHVEAYPDFNAFLAAYSLE
jgi:hypothetical protein